ncbi:MAG: hypothetical protein WDO73_28230 [Ignavibacteriota bacterium]
MLWTVVLPSFGPLAAVSFLLQFLRYHLLPILFPTTLPTPSAPAPPAETFTLTGASAGAENAPAPVAASVPEGGHLLVNALAAIMIAMVLEAVGALLSILYRAVV